MLSDNTMTAIKIWTFLTLFTCNYYYFYDNIILDIDTNYDVFV